MDRGRWVNEEKGKEESHARLFRLVTVPVKKPRPRGEYGTMPIPSSLHVGITDFCSKHNSMSASTLVKATEGAKLTL